MKPEEIEQLCVGIKIGIENFEKSKNPTEKMIISDNNILRLKIKLGRKYSDFLRFAFPEYSDGNVPSGLIVCDEDLPNRLRQFLEQQTA